MNLSYLEWIDKMFSGNEGAIASDVTSENCSIVLDSNTTDLNSQMVQIISHSPGMKTSMDKCSHLSPDLRMIPGDDVSSSLIVAKAFNGCMINIVKGFFESIKDLLVGLWELLEMTKKFGGLMVEFMKAAWFGSTATFFAEQAAQGETFFQELMYSFHILPRTINAIAHSYINDFKCMNAVARTEIICNVAGSLGPEILLATLTGGSSSAMKIASKSSMILKSIYKGGIFIRSPAFQKVASNGSHLRKLLHNVGEKIDFKLPSEFFNKAR